MIGRVFNDRYEIVQEIGEGGMAVTYRARDRLLDRAVAIKVMREQYARDPDFVARFRTEAKAAANLSHEHIAQIYDTGTDNGLHYIVMEFVEGEDLKQRLRREGRLPPAVAIEIARQAAEALDAAHAKGIVHRDIKSHNLLLTRDGKVKVTDFGIARAMFSGSDTETGVIIGSVHYFSPEQARGEPVGPQGDVYSLGVVLFEMLTGRLPFEGENPIAVAHKQIYDAPPRPSAVNPTLPPALDSVVLSCLEKNPARRCGSARELVSYLASARAAVSGEQTISQTPVFTPPPRPVSPPVAPPPPLAQPVRRGSVWAVVGIVAVVVLGLAVLGAAGWLVWDRYYRTRGDLVSVPDLMGTRATEAQRWLERIGLSYVEAGKEYTIGTEPGMVMRQEPTPRSEVERKSPVRVWVSASSPVVPVPDIREMSVRRAQQMIEESGFKAGETTEEYSDAVQRGIVIRSHPAAGTRMEKGATVDLVVSKGPEPPPEVKQATIPAYTVPQDIGTDRANVRIELEDQNGEKSTIYEGQHAPGEVVPEQEFSYTGTITMRLYLNDKLAWEKKYE